MIGLVLAATAAYGTHLLFTAVGGWRGLAPGPHRRRPPRAARAAAHRRLHELGLESLSVPELAAALGGLAGFGVLLGHVTFGGVIAPLAAAGGLASLPLLAGRSRREQHRAEAQEAWPRVIEEIRVLTGALGRSVPQALFDAGRRAPSSMQPAFADAQREWLLTTDFGRALTVLKDGLVDPTADAACETLLVAHEVGGSELDRRLEALVEDRILDVNGRKDARAKQAGARFARRFVLVVPMGMAVAGLSIGDGRSAYQEPAGQVAVAAGVAVIGLCWWWAGAIMRLPVEERVFDR